VGKQHDAIIVEESRRDQRLVLEDVEARASDASLREGPAERHLVDDGPPRGVDEHRVRLHLRQRRVVDEVACLGGQGDVERHGVGPAPELV
jgi:hypothetical protein